MTAADRRYQRLMRWLWFLLTALIVCAFAVLAAIVPYRLLLPGARVRARQEGELRLHILDVGQGDCTLVEFPSGLIFVIDAGDGAFTHDSRIIAYLKALAPASIMLAVTHSDLDHYGGCAEILRTFSVEKVYLPAHASDAAEYNRFLSEVARERCAVETLARGQAIADRSGAYLVCIAPERDAEAESSRSAAAFYLSYQGVRAVIASDAPAAWEEEVVAAYRANPNYYDGGGFPVVLADVDVLKVGHHGAADATGEAWLDLLRPKRAIISCGAGNVYGHPAGDTLTRLTAAGASLYRTDELGAIACNILQRQYSIVYGEEL